MNTRNSYYRGMLATRRALLTESRVIQTNPRLSPEELVFWDHGVVDALKYNAVYPVTVPKRAAKPPAKLDSQDELPSKGTPQAVLPPAASMPPKETPMPEAALAPKEAPARKEILEPVEVMQPQQDVQLPRDVPLPKEPLPPKTMQPTKEEQPSKVDSTPTKSSTLMDDLGDYMIDYFD